MRDKLRKEVEEKEGSKERRCPENRIKTPVIEGWE